MYLIKTISILLKTNTCSLTNAFILELVVSFLKIERWQHFFFKSNIPFLSILLLLYVIKVNKH